MQFITNLISLHLNTIPHHIIKTLKLHHHNDNIIIRHASIERFHQVQSITIEIKVQDHKVL